MDLDIIKQYSVKIAEPNPLFVKWLTEWRDRAIEKDSKMQHCFSKALDALKKYPLPLETGRDCKILIGFGDKLCNMLDNKLKLYQAGKDLTVDNEMIANGLPKKNVYVPAHRSGPYAILLVLYEESLKPDYKGYLLKKEIVKCGQKYCDKSFVKPDPGSFYTAWSSMKTLLDKKLVVKKGCPAKFSLTDEGYAISLQLYEDERGRNKGTSPASHRDQKSKRICLDIFSATQKSSEFPSNDVKSQSSSSSSQSCSQNETMIFAPYSFNILLLVDNRETSGKSADDSDDPLIAGLKDLDVSFEIRHLKVGDYAWIARSTESKKEFVLPYIIERKRMDDLSSSIKDGRFHEQKFRLKQSGIQNLIYLIESHGNNERLGLPLTTLYQAATNTLVQDNFCIKYSDNLKGTVEYLNSMTLYLTKIFKSKTLMSCPKQDLDEFKIDSDLIPLMVFEEFNKSSSKNKDLTVQDMFIRHLLQLKGVSIEKALVIVEKYPTPMHLKSTYQNLSNIEGEKLLSSLKFGNLKKNLGPVISKTIYQLFTMNPYPG